jgi:excisionase family DNA binding protein
VQTPDVLVTPGYLAQLFHVSPKTVSRWARKGLIAEVRTPGGHRRFRTQDVQELWESLNGDQ